MRKNLLFLVVPALCAGVVWSLFAQDAPAPPTRGKVLLLKNERSFEGDVEKIGESYRVRKGVGEIVVPAGEALRLCIDWDDALAFMRARAKLNDPDERLRLAKWCHRNHQLEQARAEAKAALAMRPKHGESLQLVKMLEINTAAMSVTPAPEPALPPVPQLDLSFEAVTVFSLKVQPILMNTCVNCHSGSYGGSFRLYRLHEGGERAATQRNLAAVLKHVHLDKPASSPILYMAVSAHGNQKTSPLPGRQAPTFVTLCNWIDQTLADNPHLREKLALPTKLTPSVSNAPQLFTPPAAATKTDDGIALPGVVVSQTITTPATTKTQLAVSPALPPAVEQPTGVGDPGPFNAQYHPKGK